MKKLGLVGGMGPESTVPYYHDIAYGVKEASGEDFFPELTIESVNLFKLLKLLEEGNFDEVTDYLSSAVSHLALAGADMVALTANTPHIVFDRLTALSPIPLVSIVDATVEEAVRRQYRRVGLLGTIFTMRNDFFKRPFFDVGIDIVTPTGDESQKVNHLICSELEHGIVRDSTRRSFISLIERMLSRDQIDAVILGCTELPMVLDDSVSPVPCLDTRAIHIRKLIDMVFEE